jgi:hypothetical protein
MSALSSLITITEEGEAIGTLRAFAHDLNLTVTALLDVLESEARDCVIFCAGSAPDRLLILDECGWSALVLASGRAR